MKLNKVFSKKLISLLVAFALIASYLPLSALKFSAADSEISVSSHNGFGIKTADKPTVNDWKLFFGKNVLHTDNAGTVWTDKSVFTSVSDYLEATDESEPSNFGLSINSNNFLVALSAIASSKSIEGYEAVPSDTVLILDLSASMETSEITAMITSANNAITELQNLNPNNRVAVVAYSGNTDLGDSRKSTATVILPMGRFSEGVNSQNQPAYLVSSWRQGGSNRVGVKVASGVTASLAEGMDEDSFSTSNSKVEGGGTYMQNGLYQAYELFDKVTDTKIDSGVQAGSSRLPVFVLMTDGAPTSATSSYNNVNTSNMGDGGTASTTDETVFVTQLTAAWVRDRVENKYQRKPLFYTLGLGVKDTDLDQSVLNPSINTTSGINGYWESFNNLKNAQTKTMTVSGKTVTYSAPLTANDWSKNYVNQYYPASNAEGLIDAFDAIVTEIIVQSLYYPTHVAGGSTIDHSGFLTFDDYIGNNMEIKAVKGIQLGDKLFTGQTLAKMIYEGGLGTTESPTDVGNNFVWAIMQRFGIESADTARALIRSAYESKQLYYNASTGEFSNYIGWFADKDEKFVAFWDGEDASLEAVPAEIADRVCYAMKSYGYYDAVGSGHRKTDMMYATVQVRHTLKDSWAGKTDASKKGDIQLIGRLPASLIPLVEYNVSLNGIDQLDPAKMTIDGADAPSRLLYEVGLKDSVDLLNLSSTASENYDSASGKYLFYTNDWVSLYKPSSSELIDYSYSTNRNTISFFSPSVDNERYYYHVDTEIFSDKNGTLYKGENPPDPDGSYYHRTIVYSDNGGSFSASYYYEPISEYVLSHTDDLKKLSDNSWVVLRGTLHHYYGTYIMEKGNGNYTETVHVSDMPFVHDASAGISPDEYHTDSYLGNNGKLVLEAPEGIKITKNADETILNRLQEYSFKVVASREITDNPLFIHEKANGERTTANLSFNGTELSSVTLKTGESLYIIGSELEGITFTASEIIASDSPFELKSVWVNGSPATSKTPTVATENGRINSVEFINTFYDTSNPVFVPTTAVISGEKTFTSLGGTRTLQKGAFTFELWSAKEEGGVMVADSLIERVTNEEPVGDKAAFSFSELLFNSPETVGSHFYIVKEYIPSEANGNRFEGITYDNTEYLVEVVVRDTDESRNVILSSEVKISNASAITFNNSYSVTNANISFSGEKTLENDRLKDNDFTFGLYPATLNSDGKFIKVGATPIKTVKNDANGKISFSSSEIAELNFDKIGTNRFIIEEIDENAPLTSYDPTVYYLTVDVTDNLKGSLVASAKVSMLDRRNNIVPVDSEKDINFNNTREIEPIKVEINGTKNYNKPFEEGTFRFSLYQAINQNGEIIPVGDEVLSAGNLEPSNYQAEFKIKDNSYSAFLTFSQKGNYYFVVKEKVPAGVTQANPTKDGITYDFKTYNITVSITEKVNENGRTVLLSSVSHDGEGSITFNNSYEASAQEGLAIKAEKKLENKELEDDMFSFGLYSASVDGNRASKGSLIETVKNKGKDVSFSEINFNSLSSVGTHYYIIEELNENKNGISYDTTRYLASVVVSDNGDGTLSVSDPAYKIIDENGTIGESAASASFKNTYSITEKAEAEIKGIKDLDNKQLEDNMFTFILYAASLDSNGIISKGNEIERAYNLSGSFSFTPVEFDSLEDIGTHYFVVEEDIPDDKKGVIYDTTRYLVSVVVSDNGDGTLSVSTPIYKTIGEDNKAENNSKPLAEFKNVYEASAQNGVILKAEKTLTGRELQNDMFSFELYSASVDSNGVISKTSLIETVKNKGEKVNFMEINFNSVGSVGTHYFVINEYIPSDYEEGFTFDNSSFLVMLTVTDNGDGTLSVSTPIYKTIGEDNKAGEEVETASFINSYSPPTPPPGTGVENHLLWVACSLVAASGLLIFGFSKKKRIN